tara:strand:- start:286 stop:675 length:390 start_codon:yes stop_codon:yes gene_type:complete
LTIDAGRAGEFVAAARIEMGGWRAVPATAEAVDLIAILGTRVLRVQVKSTSRVYTRRSYYFSTSRGKKQRRLTIIDCDIVAMVALDIGRCIFRRVEDVPTMTTRIFPAAMSIEAETASFKKSFGDDTDE